MTSKQKLVGEHHNQEQQPKQLPNTNGNKKGLQQETSTINCHHLHQSTGMKTNHEQHKIVDSAIDSSATASLPRTKATTTTTTTTGGLDASNLWSYFERSREDPNKLKCVLCSSKLCNYDDIIQSSPTSLHLWNHLKVKHAIDGNINPLDNSIGERAQRHQEQQQQFLHYPKTKSNNYSKSQLAVAKPTTRTKINIINANNKDNMTNHKHHRLIQQQKNCQLDDVLMPDKAKRKSSKSSESSKFAIDTNEHLRRNTDLLDYMMMPSKASLKPLPSSSLSKNLFARLNQISEPVTRKLKFWNKKSFEVNQYDPCFKVIYLGNLGIQFWSKDESCLEKPLNTLWNNYLVNMKTEIIMRLTICNSGLKAITRQHGLTQYWSNRLVYCCSHKNYPKIFAWIYRHEGKKMRQELRCHAVFCSSPERASKMVSLLSQRLACALQEFKREKKSGQSAGCGLLLQPPPARPLSLRAKESGFASRSQTALAQRSLPRTVPLRRQILAKGSANFRPPLERSKSAPKLTSIREEEDFESEEEDEDEDDDDEGDCGNDGNRDDDEDLYEDEDDTSRDEFEYEQSFGDRDEDDEDEGEDGDSSDFLGHGHKSGTGRDQEVEDGNSAQKVESNSLATTVNEEISNSSSIYATTGDISYDNIVVNKHHLLTNHERLDNESTQTAPELTMTSVNSSSAASSLQRRGSQMGRTKQNHRRHTVGQPPQSPSPASTPKNESSGDFTDNKSMASDEHLHHSVGSYQHDLDSQIAAEKTAAASSPVVKPTNATISNFRHISSSSSTMRDRDGPASPEPHRDANHYHNHRDESKESSANIIVRSILDADSSSNKLNTTATAKIYSSNQVLVGPDDKDCNHPVSSRDKISIRNREFSVASDGDTATTIADESASASLSLATTVPTSQDSKTVDEPTQDIISSWSNNLLIK